MKAQHRNLLSKTLTILKDFNLKESLPEIIERHGLIKELSELPIPQHHFDEKVIGLKRLFSHKNIRVTIYSLPPQTVMKLHNHPNMNIVTYILDGSMKANIFNPLSESKLLQNWLADEIIRQNIQRIGQQNIYTLTEKILVKGNLQFIEGIKTPKLNNLHQFQTNLSHCVFIDIIFPDYNEENRVFKTYDYKQILNEPALYCLNETQDDCPEMVQI